MRPATDPRPRPRLWPAATLAVVALALTAIWWQTLGWRPKRFAAVVPGQVYRCGSVSPAQLERLQQEYGIRSVLSLLNPAADESRLERAAARRLGIRWINVPLPGDGSSTAADRGRIRAVLLDPSLRPILVHCAAGVNRTGLAIGMYRLHVQGWTLGQVLREMRRFGFEDLPKHENLRRALATEAELARRIRAGVATSRASTP